MTKYSEYDYLLGHSVSPRRQNFQIRGPYPPLKPVVQEKNMKSHQLLHVVHVTSNTIASYTSHHTGFSPSDNLLTKPNSGVINGGDISLS